MWKRKLEAQSRKSNIQIIAAAGRGSRELGGGGSSKHCPAHCPVAQESTLQTERASETLTQRMQKTPGRAQRFPESKKTDHTPGPGINPTGSLQQPRSRPGTVEKGFRTAAQTISSVEFCTSQTQPKHLHCHEPGVSRNQELNPGVPMWMWSS